MRVDNRLYFEPPGPWPEGHAAHVGPTLALGPDGLWFVLGLETEPYRANDGGEFVDDDPEPEDDWNSRIVWNNYHRCTIDGSWLVAGGDSPTTLAAIMNATYRIDPLPAAYDAFLKDELSFRTYLLGHDDVADHAITLREDGEQLILDWRGRIALSYAGQTEFEYGFSIQAKLPRIRRVRCSKDWPVEEAHRALTRHLREGPLFIPGPTDSYHRWFHLPEAGQPGAKGG